MSIYQEIILEHYRHPQNATPLENPTGTVSVDNPLCGDRITMMIREEDGRIQEVGYEASGCAISIASASILSEHIKGKTKEEVQNLDNNDIVSLLGIELSPNRLKCALLPLESVKKALISSET
jgi:nitrogen fixation NifU-like protein